ncbi:TRAP transporter small permease subunit [Pelagibacterium xiamenense]|uniref:TRAP transporter small permease subunit n=1 Tax=Pelagibacterium xiamenense TaxID=2901140 RepID=UPI001E61683A|nr:TRAP transporter small permease subunit [Pelagibacterium xiamenense]MCD7060207.1 TRAP transporter small permease subunit [Pelagibacterium xiamenense]
MTTNDEHPNAPDEALEMGRPTGPIAEAGLLGKWIDRAAIVFAACFLVSMAVLILEIFMRYVLNAPTLWAHETTIFLCAIAFIFGGVYCAAHDRHIRVVLIYSAVPVRVRKALNVVISLICLFSAAFFAYAAWLMVQRSLWAPDGSFRIERTGSAWNPPTPGLLKLFLFVMLLVLCVQFIVISFNYARRIGR